MRAWRMVGAGALCAAFAWGCDRQPVARQQMDPARQAAQQSVQPPAQAEQPRPEPDGQRRAADGPEGLGGAGTEGGADPAARPAGPGEPRATREEESTLIVPGPGLEQEAIEDAERAATEARGAPGQEPGGQEPVVIANVEFDGRLQRIEEGRVVVRDQEGNLYEGRLEDGSRLLRRGREISAGQLRQGVDVRASFDLVQGDFVVKELEQRR